MGKQWYFENAGTAFGPISSAKLRELAESGKVTRETRIRVHDSQEWHNAGEIAGLFDIVAESGQHASKSEPRHKGDPLTDDVRLRNESTETAPGATDTEPLAEDDILSYLSPPQSPIEKRSKDCSADPTYDSASKTTASTDSGDLGTEDSQAFPDDPVNANTDIRAVSGASRIRRRSPAPVANANEQPSLLSRIEGIAFASGRLIVVLLLLVSLCTTIVVAFLAYSNFSPTDDSSTEDISYATIRTKTLLKEENRQLSRSETSPDEDSNDGSPSLTDFGGNYIKVPRKFSSFFRERAWLTLMIGNRLNQISAEYRLDVVERFESLLKQTESDQDNELTADFVESLAINFVDAAADHYQQLSITEEMRRIRLATYFTALATVTPLIGICVLILVLLAIERNTRNAHIAGTESGLA